MPASASRWLNSTTFTMVSRATEELGAFYDHHLAGPLVMTETLVAEWERLEQRVREAQDAWGRTNAALGAARRILYEA